MIYKVQGHSFIMQEKLRVQPHENIWLLPHICLEPYTATALNADQMNKQMGRSNCRIVTVSLPKVLEKYQLVFRWGGFVHLFWGYCWLVLFFFLFASKSHVNDFVYISLSTPLMCDPVRVQLRSQSFNVIVTVCAPEFQNLDLYRIMEKPVPSTGSVPGTTEIQHNPLMYRNLFLEWTEDDSIKAHSLLSTHF